MASLREVPGERRGKLITIVDLYETTSCRLRIRLLTCLEFIKGESGRDELSGNQNSRNLIEWKTSAVRKSISEMTQIGITGIAKGL
jgi:hypothetical protein